MTYDSIPPRGQQLELLWERLHPLSESERRPLLERLEAEDPVLHGEIEGLLADANRAESFFKRFLSIVEAGADSATNGSAFEAVQAGLAGRYALESELGEGGMATVYLARDLRHDREVALKVLKPELAAAVGVDRFLREIEIAARMHHPHIMPVYDSGEAAGHLYYVMPYESGRSLRERLMAEGVLPVDDAVRILRDVLDALAHAHEHSIVHRDIKPENVLLSPRHATVADFGVAKALAEATRSATATATGIAVGTPGYMSPEQAAGDATVDHRADIYAAGVLAYEMLAGRPPFTADTGHAILTAHLTQQPEPLATHRPAVTPALAELVMRCLEKRPADRWQRAGDVLARLEILGAVPSIAQPTPVPIASVRRRGPATITWLALGAAVTAVATLPWVMEHVPWGRDAAPASLIAVLPLVSPGDTDDSALAGGMTVELISKLAAAGLRPIASTSVFAFRDRHTDVRTIADSLQVPFILEGEWQKVGSALRVRVALVDARDRSTLWSQTYRREFVDVFAIQDDIARSVALELGERLGIDTAANIGSTGTGNAAAYEFYVLGSAQRAFRSDSAAQQALADLQQAIQLDPEFAAAWALLANLYIRIAPREDADMTFHERLDSAEHFVLKAAALDDSRAEVQTVLGLVRLRRFDFEEAERHLRRAIELDPSHSIAFEYLTLVYTWLGRFEDVLDVATRGLDADPLSPRAHADLAMAYYLNGRCDRAREQLEHIANLDPPVGRAREVAAFCFGLEQRWEEAIAEFTNPRATAGLRSIGYFLGRAGRREEAQRILSDFVDHWRRPGGDAFDVAMLYAGLGEFDQAFHWLELSRQDYSLRWIIMEPIFRDLHADPRFHPLLQRLGLQNR
jgi:serine/threonine-protein kinase